MLDDLASARALIERALSTLPDDPYAHLISGLIHLRADEIDEALASLRAAVDKGYSPDMLAAEPHLEPLRDHPGFRELLSSGR